MCLNRTNPKLKKVNKNKNMNKTKIYKNGTTKSVEI